MSGKPFIFNPTFLLIVFAWSVVIAGSFGWNYYHTKVDVERFAAIQGHFALPTPPYIINGHRHIKMLALVHCLVWMLGFGSIAFGSHRTTTYKRKLTEDKKRLEIMFESMLNGLVLINAQTHVIKDVNPAACRLIGASKEEILGQICHQFLCPNQLGSCPITDLSQKIDNADRPLLKKDGTKANVLKTVVPVTIDGQPHLLESFMDISEQKQMATEMKVLLSTLKKQNSQLQVNSRKLQYSEKKYKDIFNFFQDLYFKCDINGIFEILSPSLKSLFGYEQSELIGKSVESVFVNTADQKKLKAALLADGKITNYEFTVKKKDKNSAAVSLSARLIKNDTDTPIAIEGIMRDITDREKNQITLKKRVEELDQAQYAMLNMIEDLGEAKKEAEKATKAKSAFLANMSHEIRTPMNAVLGFLELTLEDQALPEHLKKHLAIARTSANSLLMLINDILDVSKLESGKLKMEHHVFSLVQLIREIHGTMDIKAREKGIELTFDIQPSLSEFCVGDSLRLRQIIINLLGNAIKFTPKGHVVLKIITATKKDQVHFMVQDTGIGILSDRVDQIFQAFSQADVSTTRKFGGTGLGTTISRELVEMMGGEIWVESEEGKGSTFHFTIDLPASAETPGKNNLITVPGKQALPVRRRALKILLTDDVKVNIELARIRLERQGHDIIVARNGREAVEAVSQGGIDIVLMDIHMPEMGGIEATNHIRAMEAGKGQHLPIIAMTASVMKEDKMMFRKAGMDAVVDKPIDFRKLFKTMDDLLPEGEDEATTKNKKNEAVLSGAELPQLEGINTSKGLQTWQNPKSYTLALLQFAHDYHSAAVNLTRFMNKNGIDTDRACHLAHALKGVAGNLSIFQVADAAACIEAAIRKNRIDDARDKIPILDAALKQALNSISQLAGVGDIKEMPEKEMNLPYLETLFTRMLAAFDQFSPYSVEPFLSELEEYLTQDQLNPVKECIERFDFDKAKKEAVKLAGALGMNHEKYRQKV